ncbi:MAG: hypothetical protein EOP51_05325 [Sphingobacteriales bacterium]|nr:MAG: hypothetical protein EOP51_05325 [Sphingobacteriales bacterium]
MLLLTLAICYNAQANDRLNVVVVQKENAVEAKQTQEHGVFGWTANRKLTWSDFRGGMITSATDETAAAICHGFGIQTDSNGGDATHVVINVFNAFYPEKSWVRDGEQNTHVLAHEQCHFDICELYTRILKQRIADAYLTRTNFNVLIKQIYTEVQAEYVGTQERYEEETNHGLVSVEQQRWQNSVQAQLSGDQYALR